MFGEDLSPPVHGINIVKCNPEDSKYEVNPVYERQFPKDGQLVTCYPSNSKGSKRLKRNQLHVYIGLRISSGQTPPMKHMDKLKSERTM